MLLAEHAGVGVVWCDEGTVGQGPAAGRSGAEAMLVLSAGASGAMTCRATCASRRTACQPARWRQSYQFSIEAWFWLFDVHTVAMLRLNNNDTQAAAVAHCRMPHLASEQLSGDKPAHTTALLTAIKQAAYGNIA